jgi:eukaryotic-like serine/threonine-protein kinase
MPGGGTGRSPIPTVTAERSPAAALAVAGIAAVAVIAVATAILGGNRTVAGALASVLPTQTPAAATPTPSPTVQPSPGPSRPVLVRVPALYGTVGDARGELRALGLRLGTVTRVDSPRPDGTILEQSPDSGVQVAWGTVVRVKVASGTNTVPVVAGLGYDEAMAALRAAGFTSADVPGDGATVVDSSTPAAGTRAAVGTAVSLTWTGVAPATPVPGPDPGSPSPSGPGG